MLQASSLVQTTMTREIAVAGIVTICASVASAQEPVRLTLGDAISRALEASHRLAEAAARESGAQAAIRTRQTADHPIVVFNSRYTRTNHVEEFGIAQPDGRIRVIYPNVPDNYLTRLSLEWPIYAGGRTDALERAAEAEARAAGADVRVARADLRLEVARAYWALATAIESERVLREALDRAGVHLRDVRSRFESGLIPPNEVSSAEAQESRQQLHLIEARNLHSSVLEELRRLTGIAGDIAPAEPLDASVPQPGTAVGPGPSSRGADTANKFDLAGRPDPAARAEREAVVDRLVAAQERRRAIEAGRRPTVAVTAAADYANPNPRIFPRRDEWRESWEVGVGLSWNLWDGGRIAAESAEAAAAEHALKARLAEVDSVIALEIKQRTLDLDSARAALIAADAAVRSAAEARRVVTERFNVGVAISTDVLDAQLALLQAELDRTRALANIRLAEARLERAQGN
jgi:outer membrane protein